MGDNADGLSTTIAHSENEFTFQVNHSAWNAEQDLGVLDAWLEDGIDVLSRENNKKIVILGARNVGKTS